MVMSDDIVIREMTEADEYYVGTCTHVNEGEENDRSCARRIPWLKEKRAEGLSVKVALQDGLPVGFAYIMPIEICPWGPLGSELMVMPCLFVENEKQKRGAGSALLEAAEEETLRMGRKALALQVFDWDFWFMPASWFMAKGYEEVGRKGNYVLIWKRLEGTVEVPRQLRPSFEFEATDGQVSVDLFYNEFCSTSSIEAERVRKVAAEFGKSVCLNEYPAEDRAVLERYQISRGIFVAGAGIGWGYEAPEEGIREAIAGALEKKGLS